MRILKTGHSNRRNKYVNIYCILYWREIYQTLGFRDGSGVKNPPVMWEMPETWVQSLGQGDPLEKGMATLSRILA